MNLSLRQKMNLKFLGMIIGSFFLFLLYMSMMNDYFGIVPRDYQTLLGDRYFLFSVANAFGVFLLFVPAFVVGVRYQIYKQDKLLEETYLDG